MRTVLRADLLRSSCLMAVLWAACAAAGAQPTFSADRLTEDRLVQALLPEPVCPPGATCRNIRAAPVAAAKPPRASLLITFATGSAELTPESRRSLDVVARAFNSDQLAPFRFVIEGHADPRGTADANAALSEARARAVRDYLVTVRQVAEDRLDPIGKGDRDPANLRDPTAPENRRVTFVTRSE